MNKLILALCIVLGTFYLWNRSHQEPTLNVRELGESPTVRRPAPPFELLDPNGNKFKLEDLRGKLSMIHFWASWCTPCLDEIPEWIRLGKELGDEFKDQSIRLVSISLDTQWSEAVKIFPVPSMGENMISLLDPSGKLAEKYGSFQYPETYLIDRELNILTKWVGPQRWNSEEVRNFVKNLIHAHSKS